MLPAAELAGLVLAGGDSRRMGTDKGALRYGDSPQARHLWELVGRHVSRCFVSVNAGQTERFPYADLPLIVDPATRHGPATGLLAAHAIYPDAAWLVVAVDLACLDERTIAALRRGRRPEAEATAMCHSDGTIEPLCAIWEPAALARMAERSVHGDPSPRRCLEAADTAILPLGDAGVLRSIDEPRDRDALLGA